MIAVYGAGMIGHALARMIGGDVEFIDARLGNVTEVLARRPEKIVLGVLDDERQNEMKIRLAEEEYSGEIVCYPPVFDARIAVLRMMADQIPTGAVAELGVYQGDFAVEIAKALPGREMHLFDSFRGFDGLFEDTSARFVQQRLPEAVIHEGYFPETFVENTYAFVSLDADLYEPTRDGLALFWDYLAENGVIMVHDYNSTQFHGVRKAVDEFCHDKKILPFPVSDLHGSVVLRKL